MTVIFLPTDVISYVMKSWWNPPNLTNINDHYINDTISLSTALWAEHGPNSAARKEKSCSWGCIQKKKEAQTSLDSIIKELMAVKMKHLNALMEAEQSHLQKESAEFESFLWAQQEAAEWWFRSLQEPHQENILAADWNSYENHVVSNVTSSCAWLYVYMPSDGGRHAPAAHTMCYATIILSPPTSDAHSIFYTHPTLQAHYTS